ncbi:threonine synthase [Tumebacillus permanentifrigoris]|uniref:Threonine synthase n=1 Tax=Tumebacillus permanentifrigoris TaxID=378543 RepID=A0A316D5H7_9BACL|nr:threonine synthase [Tumebacillus permanentifrigoris]PWK08459.1 L-threonine synthase [Tumebacillus permanentifrigoris]
MAVWKGLLHAYRDWLPINERTPLLSLCEGNTPLIPAPNLSAQLGVEIFLKFEGLNPTGSFKDRGMVLAVAKAAEEGSSTVICASTGNTSASAAAYAARLGLRSIVLIPDGKIAYGKLAQAMMYGAEIVPVQGNFDQALELVRDVSRAHPVTLVNSVNPYRIEGQKTAAFEVCEQLGSAPDYLALPVGNAGNITAYYKGFREYHKAGIVQSVPRMLGFEAEGAAAIVRGEPIKEPETIATAIRIGNPASWDSAVRAAQESGGAIDSVTDEEILAAYKLLARAEGVFCEPASAASLAGVIKSRAAGQLLSGARVVCVLTGNGLKDSDVALQVNALELKSIPATQEAVVQTILQTN